MPNPPTVSPAVAAAIRRGDLIDAIKRVRAETGLGLKEAKDLVDAHAAGRPASMTQASPEAGAFPLKAIVALREGSRIDAIRIVREERRIGLKDAKSVVDAYADAHPELLAAQNAARRALMRKFVFAVIATAIAVACYLRFAA